MPLTRQRAPSSRVNVALVAAAVTLLAAPAAAAKDFRPGDLRVCDQARRVAITNQPALDALARFYYASPPPRPVSRPAYRGSPMFELRFRTGYVTGIVAGRHLDRFLSYGVNLDQVARGRWYAVPAVAARQLAWLASCLDSPYPLTETAVARSHYEDALGPAVASAP